MAKYGKKAAEKVEKAMHERKKGALKSGRSGKKVTTTVHPSVTFNCRLSYSPPAVEA